MIARLLAAFAVTLIPLAAMAGDPSEARVKELVLEAIRENPGIVMEAVQILEDRQRAAQADVAQSAPEQNRDRLFNDPNAPVLGNPEGDVTMVEFFDYNCPYCRRASPNVEALLQSDANVRLVYREWPILGEGSVFAARAALAAREQGKYERFHRAMMGMNGRAEEASVMRIAREVGLDTEQLRRDMEGSSVQEHIDTSMRLAQAMGFNGTPSFVIGDEVAPGLLSTEQMTTLVEAARDAN